MGAQYWGKNDIAIFSFLQYMKKHRKFNQKDTMCYSWTNTQLTSIIFTIWIRHKSIFFKQNKTKKPSYFEHTWFLCHPSKKQPGHLHLGFMFATLTLTWTSGEGTGGVVFRKKHAETMYCAALAVSREFYKGTVQSTGQRVALFQRWFMCRCSDDKLYSM